MPKMVVKMECPKCRTRYKAKVSKGEPTRGCPAGCTEDTPVVEPVKHPKKSKGRPPMTPEEIAFRKAGSIPAVKLED